MFGEDRDELALRHGWNMVLLRDVSAAWVAGRDGRRSADPSAATTTEGVLMATRSWRLEWPVVRWAGWLGVLLATMVTAFLSFRLGSGFGGFTGNVFFAVVIAPLILVFLVLLAMLARGDPPMCGLVYLVMGGLVLVFGAEAGAMGFGAAVAVAAPGFAFMGAQPTQPRDWRAQGRVIVGLPVAGLVAGWLLGA